MLTKNENPKKRVEQASSKPVLIEFGEDYYDLDPVLRQLKTVMIKDTANNREFAFWNDSISVSFTEITSAVIIGAGIKVKSENEKVQQIIKDFNKNININGDNIEEWMRYVWYDEIVHGKSFWRIATNPKYDLNVDIQRIDPKTLLKVRDPKEAWTAYVQSVPDYKSYNSKLAFYRNVTSSKYFDYNNTFNALAGNPLPNGYKHITIPDEPNVILRTKFFLQPPVSPALHFITHKRWTVYFMRKFAQKHWAPFILAMVGDPKTNFYPDSPEQMEEELQVVQNILPRIANWGGAALPGNVTVKPLDTSSSKSADIYKDAIEILDQQIMYSIFASMALRSASGNEQSTQRSLLESFYTFIENIRRKYINTLKRFYVKCLLPENGIEGEDEEDLDIEFSTLRKLGWLEIAQAIERLNIAGAFKDDNETRRAAQMLFDWMGPLPEGENKKREYTTPSEIAMEQAKQPAMGIGGGSKPAAGSSQKNASNKRATTKGA